MVARIHGGPNGWQNCWLMKPELREKIRDAKAALSIVKKSVRITREALHRDERAKNTNAGGSHERGRIIRATAAKHCRT